QARQMRAPINEIVDLHQVDDLRAQQLARPPHLLDPALAARRPHLGREKWARVPRRVAQEIAGNRLGPSIHRRAVDHPPAALEEQLQHFAQWAPDRRIGADVKSPPGAEADDRHWFPGRRDRAGPHQRRGAGASRPAPPNSWKSASRTVSRLSPCSAISGLVSTMMSSMSLISLRR